MVFCLLNKCYFWKKKTMGTRYYFRKVVGRGGGFTEPKNIYLYPQYSILVPPPPWLAVFYKASLFWKHVSGQPSVVQQAPAQAPGFGLAQGSSGPQPGSHFPWARAPKSRAQAGPGHHYVTQQKTGESAHFTTLMRAPRYLGNARSIHKPAASDVRHGLDEACTCQGEDQARVECSRR
jgi:hypothetical protein